MSEPIDFATRLEDRDDTTEDRVQPDPSHPTPEPSNAVYARVGDTILRAAQDGIRRGVRPDDIIREIVTQHGVRLNLGELRLLLATRRAPEQAKR